MANKDKEQITAIIVSIAVAFVMWIYVMSDNNPTVSKTLKDVPVNLTNIENITENNLALVPGQNFMTNVAVTGKTSDIEKLTADDIRAEADMSTYLKKGDNSITVQIKQLPDGVMISDKAELMYINVKLDTFTEKSVSIGVNVSGKTKDGFGHLDPVARPSEVLVSGPSTYVNMVSSVVGQIDLNGAGVDLNGSVPLKAQDKEGKNVSYVNIEPKYVDIYISVKPSKIVPIIVKTTGTIPSDKILKDIQLKTDKTVLIGDQKNLDKIGQVETVPFDISKITASTTKEILLNLPSGVKILGDLKSINADFIVENKVEKVFSVSITPENKDENLKYEILTSTVSISLSGGEKQLSPLDSKDISATVDLKDIGEGEYSLPVKITVPDGLKILDFSPQKVEVKVTK